MTVDEYTAAVAAELKAEKAATGVSNEDLAAAVGVVPRQIIRVLAGERSISFGQTRKALDLLRVDMIEFDARVQARILKNRV
jgi:transcriptional regulator with XRE-family HTH domain